ncbi:MAG: tetratricopeptide repeat protein [Gammaproteobacteria bacterium]|nr:tetratricopeptide repeat protein [Gammaproteobacteria bacterium]MDH5650825.1 tetratricopeptide repeat protein [Gammaproteobacteria bacterium]
MDLQRTEEETVEEIKKWWRENGTAVFIGLAIGISVIVGVRYWGEYQQSQAQKASEIYNVVNEAIASKNYDVVFAQGQTLINDYSRTPYAPLAALIMAKAKFEKNNLTGAQLHLGWVIDHASDKGVQHIARIRLARLLLDNKDYVGAMKVIDGQGDSAFKSVYDELRGDIAAAQGNMAQARDAWLLALAATDIDPNRKQIIQIKLDDAAISKTASTPATATK